MWYLTFFTFNFNGYTYYVFDKVLRGLFVIVSSGLWIVMLELVGAAGAIGKGIDRCRTFLLDGLGLIAVTFVAGGLKDAYIICG